MSAASLDRSHGLGLRLRRSACGLVAASIAVVAVPAQAQDLVHRFINPSFGGNPFYSEHLLSIANIHRPAEPTTETETPSQEQLLAEQLRARLLSQLSGNILDRIQNAPVGTSDNFEFGNQRISFTRTATETRVTFTNVTTGEVNTVVLPADTTGAASAGAAAQSATAVAEAQARAAAASASLQAAGARALGTSAPAAAGIASGRPATTGGSILRSPEQSLLASGATGGGALPPY